MVIDLHAVLGPAKARRHILHDQSDRNDQPGNKATARFVVTAQEDVNTDHQRQGQHHTRRDHHHHRMAIRRPAIADDPACQTFSRFALGHGFDQGKDRKGRNAQHNDFTKGIKPTEVDEDDVHNVRAATFDL